MASVIVKLTSSSGGFPRGRPTHQISDAPILGWRLVICSAKGCRAQAQWELRWNNPRLHTPDRRKVWLACDAHRDQLERFLSARDFLRDTVPWAPPPEAGPRT